MVALVFEVYGAFCLFSLIAFLVLAAVAKSRPDAVWLYFRFPLSLRLVEEMLFERGILLSYETVRGPIRRPPSRQAGLPEQCPKGWLRPRPAS
jgi:hypothetical protein